MTHEIRILPDNRIIIRTSPVWHMVTIGWIKDQIKFSKNAVFERAYELAKKKYGNRHENNL